MDGSAGLVAVFYLQGVQSVFLLMVSFLRFCQITFISMDAVKL